MKVSITTNYIENRDLALSIGLITPGKKLVSHVEVKRLLQEYIDSQIPESDPIVDIESDPIVDIESDPIVDIESDPIVDIESDPIVDIESDPIVDIEADPIVEDEAITIARLKLIEGYTNDPTIVSLASMMPKATNNEDLIIYRAPISVPVSVPVLRPLPLRPLPISDSEIESLPEAVVESMAVLGINDPGLAARLLEEFNIARTVKKTKGTNGTKKTAVPKSARIAASVATRVLIYNRVNALIAQGEQKHHAQNFVAAEDRTSQGAVNFQWISIKLYLEFDVIREAVDSGKYSISQLGKDGVRTDRAATISQYLGLNYILPISIDV